MDIKPIHNEEEYEVALREIDKLLDAADGSPEMDRLEVLSTLVADYEDKHYAVLPPDPIEAIRFRMEQVGLSNNDLVPLIGTRSRVSEILNRKRRLTLKMIRGLSDKLRIPANVLVANYKLKKTKKRMDTKRP